MEGAMDKFIETYTVEEVAKALKVDPYTIRRLCREKKLPAFKFGGQWRFKKEKLDAWLEKQENIRR
jgi:excisionase family DNA binding protein